MRLLFFLIVALTLLLSAAVNGQEKKCEPDSVYLKDCNTCRCSPDGTSEYCTRMACPSTTPPGSYEFQGTELRNPDRTPWLLLIVFMLAFINS